MGCIEKASGAGTDDGAVVSNSEFHARFRRCSAPSATNGARRNGWPNVATDKSRDGNDVYEKDDQEEDQEEEEDQ